MRIPLAAALALTTLPVHADTLPQGEFMLGTYIWPETVLPRYATLLVDGENLSLELSYALPFNIDTCDFDGICNHAVIAATAQASVEDGELRLSNVEIGAEIPPDIWTDGMLAEGYADMLLGAIQGAPLMVGPDTFTFATDQGPVIFFETDATMRDAIRAYPVTVELSIIALDGCEVRNIAPLFTRTDLPAPQAHFRDALSGMARFVDNAQQLDRLSYITVDLATRDDALFNRHMQANILPRMLATSSVDLNDIEAVWADVGGIFFNDDRIAFETAISFYGDTLAPLVDFMRYQNETGYEWFHDAACDDLSFGFIAAQEGG